MFGFFKRLFFLAFSIITFPIWFPFYILYTIAKILFWIVTGANLTLFIEQRLEAKSAR